MTDYDALNLNLYLVENETKKGKRRMKMSKRVSLKKGNWENQHFTGNFKKITPKVAIRKFCMHCMGGNKSLIARCKSSDCPLYPHRLSRGGGRVHLKTIKTYCLHCHGWPLKDGKLAPGYKDGGQGFARREARDCTDTKCPIYPYRPGTAPYKSMGDRPQSVRGPRTTTHFPAREGEEMSEPIHDPINDQILNSRVKKCKINCSY